MKTNAKAVWNVANPWPSANDNLTGGVGACRAQFKGGKDSWSNTRLDHRAMALLQDCKYGCMRLLEKVTGGVL
jgi:hypothetical protein